MTALDVSPWITEAADSDELAAYKAKVKTVATKYAKRHEWCDVVNRALKELGIDTEKNIRVNVDLGMFSRAVLLAPSELNGKTEDQQKKVLIEKVKDHIYTGNLDLKIKPEHVVSMTILTPEPSAKAEPKPKPERRTVDAPTGLYWGVAPGKRTAHLFRLGAAPALLDYSACTRASEYPYNIGRGTAVEGKPQCIGCQKAEHL